MPSFSAVDKLMPNVKMETKFDLSNAILKPLFLDSLLYQELLQTSCKLSNGSRSRNSVLATCRQSNEDFKVADHSVALDILLLF